MRFLIDENMPRSAGGLIARYGYEAVDVRDIGLRGASDNAIAAYAQEKGLSLITSDMDFTSIRNYPPPEYPGIVEAVAQTIYA